MKPRSLLVVPLLAVLLAACGGSSPQTPARAQTTAAPVSAPTAIVTAPTAAPTAVASAPITVKHGSGALTLPKLATRVVACSEESIDFLITLGVQPIGICSDRITGAGTGAPYELPHFFPAELLGAPVFVGSADSPSLEQIVALKPDLIISGMWSEAANTKLAQIAPTFLLNTDAPGYWREPLGELGRALGREAQAQQFLADYDATAKRLAAHLAPVAADSPNILFIYSFSATDGTMVLGPTWNGSKPFELLGFKILEPEGLDLSQGGVAPASPEILSKTNADIVFVIRPKTAAGKVPRYPIDELLDSLQGPRVIRQEIDATRGSTAPYTDKYVLEEIAKLLDTTSAATNTTRAYTDASGQQIMRETT